MKVFKLEIKCENAALSEYGHGEIARILKDIARRMEMHIDDHELTARDSNGNRVGFAKFINRKGKS